MIMSRMRKNSLPMSGLVKKSAMLSAVRTKGTLSSNSSTISRIKKWRRATCFMRSWFTGLYEVSRAPRLSVLSSEGPEM